MKKLLIVSFIGFLLLLGFYLWIKFRQGESRYKNFEIIDYKLRDPSISLKTSYRLLVADNPEKWQRGLMYFRKLEGVDGMIFIFPNKEIQTFWNKNTLMDLDLLWIDEDKIVGKSFLPSIEKSKKNVTVSSPKEVNKVIEIPKQR